jgi:lipoyl(octanoyl) transferase
VDKRVLVGGIRGKAVTSLNVELGVEKVDEEEVKAKILKHFSILFEATFNKSAI